MLRLGGTDEHKACKERGKTGSTGAESTKVWDDLHLGLANEILLGRASDAWQESCFSVTYVGLVFLDAQVKFVQFSSLSIKDFSSILKDK